MHTVRHVPARRVRLKTLGYSRLPPRLPPDFASPLAEREQIANPSPAHPASSPADKEPDQRTHPDLSEHRFVCRFPPSPRPTAPRLARRPSSLTPEQEIWPAKQTAWLRFRRIA